MAVKAGEIFIGISGSAAQLISASKAGVTSLQGLAKQAVSMNAVLSTALAGSAIGGGVTFAVKLAADNEMAANSFSVLLGSAKKAKGMLADIRDWANISPFSYKQGRDAAQMMLSYGLTAQQIMPALRMLGDVAGADAQKLEGLTRAFAQTQAAGRLMGQDLLQYVSNGFNPLQEMARTTGIEYTILRAKMEQGLISASDVAHAFQSATGEGGRYFGMTATSAKTLAGLWSSAKDSIEVALLELGNQIVEVFDLKKVLGNFNGSSEMILNTIKAFKPALEELKKALYSAFTDSQQTMSPVIDLAKDMATNLGIAADVVAIFGRAGIAAFNGIKLLAGSCLVIFGNLVNAWTWLTHDMSKPVDFTFGNSLIDSATKMKDEAWKQLSELDKPLPSEHLAGSINAIKASLDKAAVSAKKTTTAIQQMGKVDPFAAKPIPPAWEDDAVKLITTLEQEIRTIGMTQHAKERDKLIQQGVTAGILEYVDALRDELDILEANKKAAEDYANKLKEMQQKALDSTVTPVQKARQEMDMLNQLLKQGAITKDQYVEGWKNIDVVKKILEDIKTPAQKVAEQFDELTQAWKAGLISKEAYLKASSKLDKEAKDAHSNKAEWAGRNTTAARDILLRSKTQKSGSGSYAQKALTTANQQLTEMKKVNGNLLKIQKKPKREEPTYY